MKTIETSADALQEEGKTYQVSPGHRPSYCLRRAEFYLHLLWSETSIKKFKARSGRQRKLRRVQILVGQTTKQAHEDVGTGIVYKDDKGMPTWIIWSKCQIIKQ